jgi:DNA-binding NarL/FixJ family response regulator
VFSPLDEFYNKDTILSSRELDILKLISAGQLSNEISDKFHFSVNTVNIHRQSILKKINVDTSIEAIRYAENLGLLDSPL